VANVGTGTAIVSVVSSKNSEVKIGFSEAMAKFVKNFSQDIKSGFHELETTYPARVPLLSSLADVFGGQVDYGDKSAMENLEKVNEELRLTISEEKGFARSFVELFAGAILKNLHLFNLFDQLVEYLHSIRAKKIILTNPLDVAGLTKKPARLSMIIRYTDLTNSYYEPIEVQTTIAGDSAGNVSVYMLLAWDD
jgi:hypothetical protein